MMISKRPSARVLGSLTVAATLLTLTACGKKDAAPASADGAVQLIGPDNVAIARLDTLRSGPPISGTIVADREARIRAEVAGAVLETFVQAGQAVSAGMPLARIDDAILQDALLSAKSGLTQATVAAEQGTRELTRAKRLLAAGAIADRDAESAERANLAAQSQLADAKVRVATAEKNLRNAAVKAPFAGVVAERSVNPGDIVAPGAPLFTVIDPSTLRVDASVPTSALGDIRVGAPLLFTVNGSDRQIEGRITRVNPMVDGQTKQVKVQASLPRGTTALVAGLFVQGRVAAQTRTGVLVPEKAVDQTGIVASVMRLKGGKVERVDVQLGLRDEGAELIETRSGLVAGDTVLLGAARGISIGTAVAVSAPKDAAPAPVKND